MSIASHAGSFDHLGTSAISESLAKYLLDVASPICVGVFAPSGYGKSYFLECTLSSLKSFESDQKVRTKSSKKCTLFITTLLISFLFTAIISLFFFFMYPPFFQQSVANQTNSFNLTTEKPESSFVINSYIITIYLSIFLLFSSIIFISCCCSSKHGNSLKSIKRFLRMIFFVLFTRLPLKSHLSAHNNCLSSSTYYNQKNQTQYKPRRFVFVSLSTRDYSGSDKLWAEIVINMKTAVEKKFGVFTSRLFYMFKSVEMSKPKANSDANSILIRVNDEVSDKTIVTGVEKYGKVSRCQKVVSGWLVTLKKFKQTQEVVERLRNEGIDATLEVDAKAGVEVGGGDNLQMVRLLPDTVVEVSRDSTNWYKPNILSHLCKYPRKSFCGFPRIYGVVFGIFFMVALPIVIFKLVNLAKLDIFRTGRLVPVMVQVVSWLPATLASSVVIFKFIATIFRSRIEAMNKRIKFSSEEISTGRGFMGVVKKEIQKLEKFIDAISFVDGIDYKVVIIFNGLERCPVAADVLDVVNVLTSSKHSPLMCLVGLEPIHTYGKGSEKELMTENFIKNVIDIPICLPKLSKEDKGLMISGLINETARQDSKQKNQKKDLSKKPAEEFLVNSCLRSKSPGSEKLIEDQSSSLSPNLPVSTDPKQSSDLNSSSDPNPTSDLNLCSDVLDSAPATSRMHLESDFSKEEFLHHCRKYFNECEEVRLSLDGNPRLIKRFFNIITLATILIEAIQKMKQQKLALDKMKLKPAEKRIVDLKPKKLDAKSLVDWLMFCEQWPCRSSFLYSIISDDEEDLLMEKPLAEIFSETNFQTTIEKLDIVPVENLHQFHLFLQRSNLTVDDVINYETVSINLNQFWKRVECPI